MLVDTMVTIFHAQNLLHILKKKEQAGVKFINFSQKYKGSVFWGHPVYASMPSSKTLAHTNVFGFRVYVCIYGWVDSRGRTDDRVYTKVSLQQGVK